MPGCPLLPGREMGKNGCRNGELGWKWVFVGVKMGVMIRVDTLVVTSKILNLIAEIDEVKGYWKAMGNLAPERLVTLRRVATIESAGSSTRIEGSKLSDREVEELLQNLELQSFRERDEEEVAGYAKVLELVLQSWEVMTISENLIKQLHRDLLAYSRKDERHRGEYKTTSNQVAAFDQEGRKLGVVFEPATPFETPGRMRELVEWFLGMRESEELHPLLVIGVFVVVFLEIHPFQDGNGRLSRILTTLLLLQAGYGYVPYSSLERVIEQNKEAYYLALRESQGTIRSENPNWQPWLHFFLEALQQQARHLKQKVEREQLLRSRLPPLSATILDHVRGHGRATIAELQVLTGANRNTLKAQLRALVRDGYLELHGRGRGAWYSMG